MAMMEDSESDDFSDSDYEEVDFENSGSDMSYRRFCQIKQNLHFSNIDAYDASTHLCPKLNKIWPILQHLLEKFQSAIIPERDITMDESLLLYKGRLGWVQYIPLKRARFGIKSFLLCESKSGYVWNAIIYSGMGTNFDNSFDDLPMSARVVMTLTKPLLDKGYCLTMDNFYNSPGLADTLVKRKTDVCGTLRLNRKDLPPDLKTKKLKKGEITGYQRGKVTVMKWKDKKDVSLISTIHTIEIQSVTNKRGETKSRPKCVVDYNDKMGGVDKVDQHLAAYSTPRKRGKKYYKKVFFHLLDLALWNSYILHCKSGGSLSPKQFRMELIEKLISENHRDEFSTTSGRPSTSPSPLRLTSRHFPDVIPATEKKSNPTRQCTLCSRKRDSRGKPVRKETRYQCTECQVSLCVVPCFKNYHTKTNI